MLIEKGDGIAALERIEECCDIWSRGCGSQDRLGGPRRCSGGRCGRGWGGGHVVSTALSDDRELHFAGVMTLSFAIREGERPSLQCNSRQVLLLEGPQRQQMEGGGP